ncbi:nitrous oxide reductase accessory protein NosL [Shewanella sp. NIFS-20-20]|uniref:nitrous oxide reductase accessory protein NosL n=1 Tax=Shewanella sp. NIFS-20-20 TaxID=2853806 RepID=UPI001C458587|nr:nitrous oxide reductase accessory protein NosL [Shewanella sp. NIFS-20-20]MBV7316973.1 nitrous oxide reductase accessory protein NosL [Shewanella sp. NIFS-20-20]
MKKLLTLLLIPLAVACSDNQAIADISVASTITEHDRCHLCGMMITKYPGPKGQVVIDNGDYNPKFCSSRDMFTFALQPENKRQVTALFVHDVGVTDWAHPQDSAFIDAKAAYYVYGTSKKAVMGPAVAPFSSLAAAEAFANEFGGDVLSFEDITLELLGRCFLNH